MKFSIYCYIIRAEIWNQTEVPKESQMESLEKKDFRRQISFLFNCSFFFSFHVHVFEF